MTIERVFQYVNLRIEYLEQKLKETKSNHSQAGGGRSYGKTYSLILEGQIKELKELKETMHKE